MQYKYHIQHSEDGKGKLERSLTEKELLEAHNQLPDFLNRYFDEQGIKATYTNNITIEFESDKPENEIKSYLANLLRKYNKHIDGLSFIMER